MEYYDKAIAFLLRSFHLIATKIFDPNEEYYPRNYGKYYLLENHLKNKIGHIKAFSVDVIFFSVFIFY